MTARGVYTWCRRYINVPLVGVAVFVVYVCFINDDNSVMDRFKYEARIKELKAEIQANEDSLQYYRQLNRSLDTDPAAMERVVREHYYMQRKNEDVYVYE